MDEATRKKWFEDLRESLWQVIASVELTPQEGDALIEEIRIRVRKKYVCEYKVGEVACGKPATWVINVKSGTLRQQLENDPEGLGRGTGSRFETFCDEHEKMYPGRYKAALQ